MLLYLCNGSNEMIQEGIKNSTCEVQRIYRSKNKILKGIEKILFKKTASKLFLSKWANEIEKYDVIVIEALKGKENIIEFLKARKNKKARIILWHWNTIFENSILPNHPICKDCEIWSFDPEDCKKYGMKYNTQYYDSSQYMENCCESEFDVWFLGADKGRLKKLLDLQESFKQVGVTSEFHITRSGMPDFDYPYKKNISYKDNLKQLSKSKAVLDCPKEGQNGLTLRPLEALFNKKKVITTDKSIENQKFYTSTNIFIIGKDLWEKLPDFLQNPFDNSKNKQLEYYDVSNWLTRFRNNKSDEYR